MRRAFIISIACFAIGLVSGPASALGQGGGGAAGDEYTEDIPGGGNGNGNESGSGTGGSSSGGSGGTTDPTLSPSQEAGLQSQGADGAAAANAANETGFGQNGDGDGAGNGAGGSASGASDLGEGASSPGGGSAFDDVIEAVTGSDESGMGPILPIVLIASLLVAVGLVAVRRLKQGQGT